MPRFLSAEWIEALARAAATRVVPDGTPAAALQVEVNCAGDLVVWVLEIAATGLTVRAGPSPTATVRLHTDEPTAVALATGALNTQLAVAADRVRIEGDLAAIAGVRNAFDALGDVFADVRAATTFPAAPRRR